MKKMVLLFAIFIFSLANFISADNASSTTYSIESYHLSSVGGNGTSSTYSEESTSGFQQGDGNFSSSTYTGGSVWFPLIPDEEESSDSPSPSPSSSSPSGSGGSSGGGSIATIVSQIPNLKIIPDSFGLTTTAGTTISAKLSLENTGAEILNIKINTANLDNIVFFENSEFSILPGEQKTLEFKLISPSEPGILTGKIVLNSAGRKTEIPFALNINSEFSLFDVSIELAQKVVSEGQNLLGQITLIQAGLQEEQDVRIEYSVKDFEGNTYLAKSETIAVFREKTFEYEFETSELPQGDYVVGVEVIYPGGVATASHQFKIVNKKAGFVFSSIFFTMLIIAAFILIVLIIIAKNYKQNKKI